MIYFHCQIMCSIGIGMGIIGIGIRLFVALVWYGYAKEADIAPHRGVRLAPLATLAPYAGQDRPLDNF